MITQYFKDGGRTDNTGKNLNGLKYQLEEKSGYRPKLNGFESFLVNNLNIPRNYVQPYWSIDLEKTFQELRNLYNTTPLETIQNILLKPEKNNKKYQRVHKVDEKDQTPSKRCGGNIRFQNKQLIK